MKRRTANITEAVVYLHDQVSPALVRCYAGMNRKETDHRSPKEGAEFGGGRRYDVMDDETTESN